MSISVKVQPGARQEGILGLVADVDGSRLKIAVRAAPEDGQATRSACAVLAAALSVPTSDVRVLAGAASRQKIVFVSGDAAVLAARLRAHLEAA
jgi:uncharacterized protein YggU (UPF0235/DUF167 family)